MFIFKSLKCFVSTFLREIVVFYKNVLIPTIVFPLSAGTRRAHVNKDLSSQLIQE